MNRVRTWHAVALFAALARFASRPMEASNRATLVFAPHQDDETFGCGGLIALKCRRGVPVTVVFLTDGTGGGPEACSRQVRHREAVEATAALGLWPEDLRFLDYPDDGLGRLSADAQDALVEHLAAILETVRPEEVYVPHRRDRHVDHEAAYRLATAAVARSGICPEVFQYAIWVGWWSALGRGLAWRDLAGARRLSIAEVGDRKARAINLYRSQLAALPQGFRKRFSSRYEIFFGTSGP